MSPWHSVSQGPSTTLLCWCREDTPRSQTHWLSSSNQTHELHCRLWAAPWAAGDVQHLTQPSTQMFSNFSSQCPQMLNQVKQLSKASPDHFTGISVHLTSWKTFHIGHYVAVTIQHYKSRQVKVFPRGVSVREMEAAISQHLQKERELLTFCTTSTGNSSRGL